MFQKSVLFFIFLSSSIFASTLTLKVGVYENKPKIFLDANKVPSGFFPDLLGEIAKKEKWQLEYIPCEWDECLQKLENNEIDIMPDVAHSKERENRFAFGKEVVLSSWSEIYTTKKTNIVSIIDLDNKKIAVLENSIQYYELLEFTKSFHIKPIFIGVKSFDDAFALLNSNSVDAAAVNTFYIINASNIKNIKKSNILFNPVMLKFAYSKRLPTSIQNKIDTSIQSYKKNQDSIYYVAKKRWLEVEKDFTIPYWLKVSLILGILSIAILMMIAIIFKYLLNKKIKEVKQKSLQNKILQEEQIEEYKEILLALVKMIEQRDSYTAGHSQRVAKYSKMLACEIGVDEESCEILYQAGILHDIGKVAIPDVILLKPENLNDREYALIKEHVEVGVTILEDVPKFRKLAEIIKYHHEKYDGSGYPYGLKGEEIPKLSRIMIVADAFDAMTTSRIYRHKKSVDFALNELEKLKYIQFHPEVVDCALRVFKDIQIEDSTPQTPNNKLEEERFVYFYKDNVTQLFNNKYFKSILMENEETHHYSYLYIFSLHNFAQYNYEQGWEIGDTLLINFANILKENFDNKIICRLHADNFVILSHEEIVFKDDFLFELKDKLVSHVTYSLQYFDLTKEDLSSINTILKNFKFKTNLIYFSSDDLY
jgi:putative nucleotidyltransferase with HDIG domain